MAQDARSKRVPRRKKIVSSVQSHGSLGKRNSEGAVPSTGHVPVPLNRARYHNHLLQALSCVTETRSLSSLNVSEYLLGMSGINLLFSIISSGYGLFLKCPTI